MSKILISFLGKARKDQENGQYRMARYRFGVDTLEETRYFGQALARQLQPDRMVLLGTSGSMWDVLIEDTGVGEEQQSERMALIDEVERDAVDEARLQALGGLLSRQVGKPCHFRVIPYGRDAREQTRILELMAEEVQSDDEVHLDLTHGFRHLPMLGLLSALYLRTVKQAKIGGLYYGALDMTDKSNGETPVLRLDGLLSIADWVGAIGRYDQSGDYGVFAPLLPNRPEVEALQQAAYHERTSNSSQAREKLSTFHGWFKEATASLSPEAQLFCAPLEKRIAWFKKSSRAEREQELAENYLQRKDYLRAVIFGYESLVTRKAVELRINPSIFQERDRADKAEERQEFKELKNIRNSLAHGTVSITKTINKVLELENSLNNRVKGLFAILFKPSDG